MAVHSINGKEEWEIDFYPGEKGGKGHLGVVERKLKTKVGRGKVGGTWGNGDEEVVRKGIIIDKDL